MSPYLQIALCTASAAVALFVLLLIPLSILLYRRVIAVSRQMEELNTEVIGLVQDSRTMVQNISSVIVHVNGQLDELDQIAGHVRGWSDRVDHVAEAVGATLEFPLLTVARSFKGIYRAWKFMKDLVDHSPRRTNHGAGARSHD